MTTPPARPIFDPVDTTFNRAEHERKDDVESPSLSSGNALARFEFEPGRSKDGTKVLMVEWEDDDTTRHLAGDWEISWEGKHTVLPARDQPPAPHEEAPVHRLYFLLGAGVQVPSTVLLRKGETTWRTNPLPAIFSPELGASARQAGKKGVLHTIWAKKRLQVLQREIDAESKTNAEGVGLEIAVAEKEWIEQNFGVVARPGGLSLMTHGAMASVNVASTPISPRSPGGGRLMDKLKGLRLETSSQDRNGTAGGELHSAGLHHNPLSPEGSDVAVGSFGSFAALKGMPPPSSMGAKPAQSTQSARRFTSQRPPDAFAAQQRQQGGMGSLNAVASGTVSSHAQQDLEDDEDDDLFALPISPRSPEMAKSPFSFAPRDPLTLVKGERT